MIQSRTQDFGKSKFVQFLSALRIVIAIAHDAVIFAAGGRHGLPSSPPRQLSPPLTVVLASMSSANVDGLGAVHLELCPRVNVRNWSRPSRQSRANSGSSHGLHCLQIRVVQHFSTSSSELQTHVTLFEHACASERTEVFSAITPAKGAHGLAFGVGLSCWRGHVWSFRMVIILGRNA